MTSNSNSPIYRWTMFATIVQLAMVLTGHFNEFVRINVFAIGGMSISLLFGGLCALRVAERMSSAISQGTIVGGISALIGIAVSVALGDVPMAVLLFGTAGSALAGLIGGAVFFGFRGKRPASTSTVA